LVSPKPRCEKNILILSLDAKNDFNPKPKYSKSIFTQGQYSQNYSDLKAKCPSQNMFGFCLNYVAYNLTLAQNKLIFKNVFLSMA